MGIVLDDATVLAVMAVKDGRREIYGHCLFADVAGANRWKDRAVLSGDFDEVYVTRLDVV